MKSTGDQIGGRLRLAALIFVPAFLLGCASAPSSASTTPSSVPTRVVVGQGSTDDRKIITSSDQQMYDAERGISPDSPTPVDAPGQQGIP